MQNKYFNWYILDLNNMITTAHTRNDGEFIKDRTCRENGANASLTLAIAARIIFNRHHSFQDHHSSNKSLTRNTFTRCRYQIKYMFSKDLENLSL